MNEIDLFSLANTHAPGGGQVLNKKLEIKINSKYKINRLALTFDKPILLDENKSLLFTISYLDSSLIQYDILRGDLGIPEISIVNEKGVVYRFKRGNLKDFLGLINDSSYKEVALPLSTFIFHNDLKSNVKSNEPFFSFHIVKVYFDFLSDSSTDTICNIGKMQIIDYKHSKLSYKNLFNINRNNVFYPYEIYIVESSKVSFSFSKSEVSQFFYPDFLTVEISYAKKTICFVVGSETKYIELPVDKMGNNSYKVKVTYKESIICEDIMKIIRTVPKTITCSSDFLGISDGYSSLESFKNLGGKRFRTVFDLGQVLKEGSNYRFSTDLNPFKMLNNIGELDVWIAIKCLPKWLSSRPDIHDYYRYAPYSYEEYRLLMKWFFVQCKIHNVSTVEIWNEANVIHEWNDSFEPLLKMTQICFEVRNEIYPECKIASPSSTSWDFDYFSTLGDLGVYDYCDYIALHSYTYQPENVLKDINRLNDLVLKYQHSNKRLTAVISEIGMRTPTFTDLEQAEWLSAYSLISFSYKTISAIYWFRLKNPRFEKYSSYDQNASTGYAMIGYEGKYARSMYGAYRSLMRLFESLIILEIKDEVSYLNLVCSNSIFDYIYIVLHPSDFKQEFDIDRHEIIEDIFGNKLSSYSNQRVLFKKIVRRVV